MAYKACDQMEEQKALSICLIAIMIAIGFSPKCFAATSATDAKLSIDQAKIDLNSAFAAVSRISDAGGSVNALISRLDASGNSLSGAYIAFNSGDYEGAALLASECSRSAAGLIVDAQQLESRALLTENDTLLFTAIASGVGLILLILLGVAGWKALKKRFLKQILDLKPELEGTQ